MIVFDPQLNLSQTSVLIVGLGGTGSALARHVCRIVYDMRARNLQPPRRIAFIDPDCVEQKNVGRQMFTASDVGRYKAEVLARRFNQALGLDVQFFNEPFEAEKHAHYYGHGDQNIIIGCVDNYLARRTLAQASSQSVWIDCGNETFTGQVVIGSTSSIKDVRRVAKEAKKRGDNQWRHSPNAALLFPALLEPDTTPVAPVSCADLMLTGEQHILINDNVANIAANYFYKLCHRQPITSFATFVDIDSLSMRSIPLTREDLAAYGVEV